MSQRKQVFADGEYYHLYSRGVEKRGIFIDKQDYEHFLFLMYVCNTRNNFVIRDIKKFERGDTIVDIGAYCLMPNHFHILVREKESGISSFMHKLLTSYSMYFNKKYERTGRLFESVFKSSYIGEDNYLKYIYSYIHLNPAKIIDPNWREKNIKNNKKVFDFVFGYPYSSLVEYNNSSFHILNPKKFPSFFEKISDHKSELYDWLNLGDLEIN